MFDLPVALVRIGEPAVSYFSQAARIRYCFILTFYSDAEQRRPFINMDRNPRGLNSLDPLVEIPPAGADSIQ